MELACNNCWEEKQKNGGDMFDVNTEHAFDYKTKTAKCTVCGNVQDVEVLGEQ